MSCPWFSITLCTGSGLCLLSLGVDVQSVSVVVRVDVQSVSVVVRS